MTNQAAPAVGPVDLGCGQLDTETSLEGSKSEMVRTVLAAGSSVLDSPRRREQEVGEKDPEAYFCVSLSGSSDRDAGRGSTLDPVPEMADGDEMGVGLQIVPMTPERDIPSGGPPLEDQSFARIKSFCAKILKNACSAFVLRD
jgi:hypothetical protein